MLSTLAPNPLSAPQVRRPYFAGFYRWPRACPASGQDQPQVARGAAGSCARLASNVPSHWPPAAFYGL